MDYGIIVVSRTWIQRSLLQEPVFVNIEKSALVFRIGTTEVSIVAQQKPYTHIRITQEVNQFITGIQLVYRIVSAIAHHADRIFTRLRWQGSRFKEVFGITLQHGLRRADSIVIAFFRFEPRQFHFMLRDGGNAIDTLQKRHR